MQLDLNLLTALDALLEEGSVGGAAFRLNLSEPAVSRTLGRLRRVTGDMILVRTGRSMTPTPYAQRVREEVHTLIQRARALLAPPGELELGQLERRFTLRCHDAITLAVGPTLLRAVQAQAPGVQLRFLTEPSGDSQALRHGQVDLELGSSAPERPELRSEALGHDRLVVVLRPDHPLTQGELSAERYAAARHVSVSRRGRLHDPVDDLLAARGLSRQVVTTVPTSAAALQFVRQGEAVTLLPERMCRELVQALGLLTRRLPLPTSPAPVILTWHQRTDGEPAHRWLRAQVRGAVEAVVGTTQEAGDEVMEVLKYT